MPRIVTICDCPFFLAWTAMWARNAGEMLTAYTFPPDPTSSGKEAAEEPRSRADIGHRHPRLQSQQPA